MNRRRRLLISLVTFVAVAATASAAQAACTETWIGPGGTASAGTSGDWGTAANWSPATVPAAGCTVNINVPGTYTVTLASPDTSGGATVGALTLGGGSSGTQSLDISGQDYNYAGDLYNATTLSLTAASTIAANGQLVLDATDSGATTTGATGGGVFLDTASLANAGQIVSKVDANAGAYTTEYSGQLTNASTGTVAVNSGTFSFPAPDNGGTGAHYSYSFTNNGSLSVGSGATLALTNGGGFINPTVTNAGTVTNGGTIVDSGVPWAQSGGAISGNAITMQNGAALIDSVGTGSFLFNYASGSLSGTIPAGQTITVQGETYNSNGDSYSGTSLALNAGGNTAPVTNNGTVVLDAPGSGGSSGGPADLTSGTLDNNGTVISQNEDTNWRNDLQASINNSAGANVNLTGGNMLEEGSTLTNSGTVTVAPTGLWVLDEGGAFVNTAAGTLNIDIASATTTGDFQLNNPCCSSPGAFTAGGTLNPTLVGGYVPPVNQLFSFWSQGGGPFTGTFASVSGGFTGDYGATSDTYGVIYAPTPATTPPVTQAATSVTPSVKVDKVSAGKGDLIVKLTCSAGTVSCSRASITGTVTEHLTHGKVTSVTALSSRKKVKTTTKILTVASATGTLKAGTTRTFTLTLNKTGRALLARLHKLTIVTTVVVQGKTVKRETVVLRAPVRKTKTKKKA